MSTKEQTSAPVASIAGRVQEALKDLHPDMLLYYKRFNTTEQADEFCEAGITVGDVGSCAGTALTQAKDKKHKPRKPPVRPPRKKKPTKKKRR